jgi:hypothetical protein
MLKPLEKLALVRALAKVMVKATVKVKVLV